MRNGVGSQWSGTDAFMCYVYSGLLGGRNLKAYRHVQSSSVNRLLNRHISLLPSRWKLARAIVLQLQESVEKSQVGCIFRFATDTERRC